MSDSFDELTRIPSRLFVPGTRPETDSKPDFPKEDAAALTELFLSENWKVMQRYLDEWYTKWSQPCEVYANHPEEAKFDAGLRQAISFIRSLKEDAQYVIDFYAKETGRETQENGKQDGQVWKNEADT